MLYITSSSILFRRIVAGACGLCSALSAAANDLPYTGPISAGRLEAPPKHETSGLAASRRAADILWTHDDSGGQPVLYAVSPAGKFLGALRVQGEKNEDWEDIASYEYKGKAWLLVGDIGDNDAKRPTVSLHIVEEPLPQYLSPKSEESAKPVRTLRVRYEDGPRDCESVAVDAAGGAIYLLSKRNRPPQLYRVDLDPPHDNAIVIARRVGDVSQVPQPNAAERLLKGHLGKYRAQITAMDFAADGSAAAVVTYGDLLLFLRRQNEPWADAFSREPLRLAAHNLPQAEAVCFSADGKLIYVASEGEGHFVHYEQK